MIAFVKRMWRAAPIATVILAIALLLSAGFTYRTIAKWVYWNDPARHEQPIAAWMTPGYIAHSWDVPRRVLMEALNAPMPPLDGPMNLSDLAARNGVPVADLVAAAEAAIAEFRASETPGER